MEPNTEWEAISIHWNTIPTGSGTCDVSITPDAWGFDV